MGINIGFVSTRFAGTDGVSMEASKWAEVLRCSGHHIFWFAGETDKSADCTYRVPEAHFQHELNDLINQQVFGRLGRTPMLTESIHKLRAFLKMRLHEFFSRYSIDLLIVENALTIPMHVPLGLALTEAIAESRIPTIAHHHDFHWERTRYSVNAVGDYLSMAFPPRLPDMAHVVINTEAREQLALRSGLAAVVIPNVINFEQPPQINPDHTAAFRESIGLNPEDRMILQPTRIVQRKGIEHAVALVKALDDPRNKLVISHEAGDEGYEYFEWLKASARENGVDLRLVSGRLKDPWSCSGIPGDTCSLWDIYPHADFITYPSLLEGFGNAFLEAIYFRKPMLVNRYSVFIKDIEPLGFDLAVMDGFLNAKTVARVQEILQSPEKRKAMTDHNYTLAARHFSYRVLRQNLDNLLAKLLGDTVAPLLAGPETDTRACLLNPAMPRQVSQAL
jgi:glycosyltransferase involved in cell wall biosynthesis